MAKPYEEGLYERLRDISHAASYIKAAADEDSMDGFLLALRDVAEATKGMSGYQDRLPMSYWTARRIRALVAMVPFGVATWLAWTAVQFHPFGFKSFGRFMVAFGLLAVAEFILGPREKP